MMPISYTDGRPASCAFVCGGGDGGGRQLGGRGGRAVFFGRGVFLFLPAFGWVGGSAGICFVFFFSLINLAAASNARVVLFFRSLSCLILSVTVCEVTSSNYCLVMLLLENWDMSNDFTVYDSQG